MYKGLGMDDVEEDHTTDFSLEYSEKEIMDHLKDFYDDVLTEFQKFGKVVNMKVFFCIQICRNSIPHLKGGVHVEYDNEESAENALKALNGRFYGGKQLKVELLPPTALRWEYAVCGQYLYGKCGRGNECHYLHPFKQKLIYIIEIHMVILKLI